MLTRSIEAFEAAVHAADGVLDVDACELARQAVGAHAHQLLYVLETVHLHSVSKARRVSIHIARRVACQCSHRRVLTQAPHSTFRVLIRRHDTCFLKHMLAKSLANFFESIFLQETKQCALSGQKPSKERDYMCS